MAFGIGSITLAITPSITTAAARVTGCVVGRSVNLYRCPWVTTSGSARPWTLVGTDVADAGGIATVADTVGAVGYYEWLAVQLDVVGVNADSLSNPIFNACVDPSQTAVWDQCVDHTKTIFESLNIAVLPPDKIIKRTYPGHFENIAPQCPQLQVCPFSVETYPGALNNTDDVGYPVLVLFVDAVDRDSVRHLSRNLRIREQLSRSIRFQAPVGITDVYYTDLEPGALIDSEAWKQGLVVSSLLFRYRSREARGIY